MHTVLAIYRFNSNVANLVHLVAMVRGMVQSLLLLLLLPVPPPITESNGE